MYEKQPYLINVDSPLQKRSIIFALKCTYSKENLSYVIENFTNGKVSLKDYKGDGSYEDLYNFIVENGDLLFPFRKKKSQ